MMNLIHWVLTIFLFVMAALLNVRIENLENKK